MLGRSWRLAAGAVLIASVVAYWVSLVAGHPPDQLGLVTKLVELAALAVVLRPERRSAAWRSLAGSTVTVSLVVLTGIVAWAGAFMASEAHGDDAHAGDAHGGAMPFPSVVMRHQEAREPTADEQKAAAVFHARAVAALAPYADPAVAAADGYRVSGIRGEDFHASNPSYQADDLIFDPERPENLIYAATEFATGVAGSDVRDAQDRYAGPGGRRPAHHVARARERLSLCSAAGPVGSALAVRHVPDRIGAVAPNARDAPPVGGPRSAAVWRHRRGVPLRVSRRPRLTRLRAGVGAAVTSAYCPPWLATPTETTTSRRRIDRRPAVAPEHQGVTFVELFFDLVFVFGITQSTALLRHDLNAAGALRFVLVFWLLWWGWTQFTWALNTADTTDHRIELAVLAATVAAFAMATGVDRAYTDGAAWFAIPYICLRAIGLMIYIWISTGDALHRTAVRRFSIVSAVGLVVAGIGAFVEPPVRTWLWVLVVVIDLVAAGTAGRRGMWQLRAGHFAERHGLFVILALGESLIAAGVPLASSDRSAAVVLAAAAAVVLTCALWWTYFSHSKPALEAALEATEGRARSAMARDAYSLLHFPLTCGVVAIAVALEEALEHPSEALPSAAVIALAAGVALFAGGVALVHRRAVSEWLWERLALVAMTVAAILVSGGRSPSVPLTVAAAGLVAIAVVEERRFGPRHASGQRCAGASRSSKIGEPMPKAPR